MAAAAATAHAGHKAVNPEVGLSGDGWEGAKESTPATPPPATDAGASQATEAPVASHADHNGGQFQDLPRSKQRPGSLKTCPGLQSLFLK